MKTPFSVAVLMAVALAMPAEAAKKKPTAPLSISAKDKATGAKAHPEILKQFGDLYTGPQAAYVTRIGKKVAIQSGLSNAESDFTISLINSPVNNAFAVPGGYVYVTRQLMALMNSEAELASVLGHEIGHVAGRHAQKRQSRAQLGSIGTVLAGVLGGAVAGDTGARLGQQVVGTAANSWVLGFSRAQEHEADDLGVNYIAQAGYDPLAASTMLAGLAAQTSLDTLRAGKKESALPEWASTHPDPASRVTRTATRARTVAGATTLANRDAYLAAIDGMLYDDDPKQGVIDGTAFKHPDLRVAFQAPNGYVLANSPSAVTISGTGGQAQFSGGAYSGNLNAYVGDVFKAISPTTALNYGLVQTTTTNGLPTAYASANANTTQGAVTVTVHAYEFSPTSAFHILALTRGSSTGFDPLFSSVRRLTASEAAAIKPRRVDIVTVRSGDTVASLAQRMAYTDYKLERFQTLNALTAGSTLKQGQKVKLIIFQD